MNKQKRSMVAVFIFSCFFSTGGKAQTFDVESFDGVRTKINLSYTLYSKRLTATCLNDTFYLDDYTGTIKAHVISRNFLEIDYSTRGGSNLQLEKAAILYVINHQINASILVTKSANAVSGNEKKAYTLKFVLSGYNQSSYKIFAIYHQDFKSKTDSNYSIKIKSVLNFDTRQHVFYSNYESINKELNFYDVETQKEVKHWINEKIPIIKLGRNYSYYFINGEWYEMTYNNQLMKYSQKRG
jgi:hypothetical protein